MSLTPIPLVSVDVVINEVKNFLTAYFESGVLDDSLLYSAAQRVNSVIGLRMMPSLNRIIQIENYKAELPEDFRKLNFVLLCSQCKVEVPQNLGASYVKEERIHSQCELLPYEIPLKDDCGMYRAVQKFPTYIVETTDLIPVKVTTDSRKFCSSDCPNLSISMADEVQVTNTHIVTQFPSGFLYIDYVQDVHSKDLMVVDHPKIIKWIREEMVYECLKKLYYNGDDSVAQKLQFQAKETHVAEINARNVLKPEVSDFYASAQSLLDRFNYLKNVVTGIKPARTWTK